MIVQFRRDSWRSFALVDSDKLVGLSLSEASLGYSGQLECLQAEVSRLGEIVSHMLPLIPVSQWPDVLGMYGSEIKADDFAEVAEGADADDLT